MKIYTKTGDKGTTRLGNGVEVSKDDLAIEAIGDVDELNSVLGIISASYSSHTKIIKKIQNDLFQIGAELCLSRTKYEKIESDIRYIEDKIDCFDKFLKPLQNFILPGGNKEAAWYHHARTVCRRAERRVVSFFRKLETEQISHNKNVIIYLNRLSDWLFIAARYSNDFGSLDIIWKSS